MTRDEKESVIEALELALDEVIAQLARATALRNTFRVNDLKDTSKKLHAAIQLMKAFDA